MYLFLNPYVLALILFQNSNILDLEYIDIKIDDEDKAVLLVVSLPSTYKHFKEIMLYGNNETLSFTDVKSNLWKINLL
jgi:hypothetical protein